MSKRALLRCDGSIDLGLRITLEISEQNAPVFTEAIGTLPAAIELDRLLTQWQQAYHQSLGTSRIAIESVTVRTGSFAQIATCKSIEQQLKSAFKSWLASPEFQPIDRRLREVLSPQAAVEILLRSTDLRLHRLPWHVWDLIERYPQAELVIGSPSELITAPPRTSSKIRILAIFGDRRGIDTAPDRAEIEAIPDAEVITLIEPAIQAVYDHLWEQTWDILFFAGHSSTEQHQGRIYLNSTESLTLEELRFGLQRAIAKGLQLTIFNSCDGLGLAYELAQLHIPHSIVMREPVPDRVAQAFLKRFLTAFAGGETLHLAVRAARESLQALEAEFPAASWLPIAFQNPTVPPLTWQGLQGCSDAQPVPIALPRGKLRQRLQLAIAVSMAMTGLILGVRYIGMLQSIELSAYDFLMRSRPAEKPDSRLLIVTVTEADIQAQNQSQAPRRGSLADRALVQLLDKLIPAQPAVIGLDIYRDYPASTTAPTLANQLQTDRIVGVCKVSDEAIGDPGVAPPPEISPDRVGFSDILLDPDRIVRRHYLALEPPPISPCKSHYALSVQLALRYLATQGINLKYLPPDLWQLGTVTFAPLETHSGGYQKISPFGHQILLNYRSSPTPLEIAPTVTLGEVLAGRISPEVFKNRIVLIGTTAQSFRDDQLVPDTTDRGEILSMPGVILQAQMVSQLVSAVLDKRPLIQTCPIWIDALWIWGFGLAGGLLVVSLRQPLYLGLAGIGSIGILSGTCLFLFQLGYWLPLVPAAIGIIGTGAIISLIDRRVGNER